MFILEVHNELSHINLSMLSEEQVAHLAETSSPYLFMFSELSSDIDGCEKEFEGTEGRVITHSLETYVIQTRDDDDEPDLWFDEMDIHGGKEQALNTFLTYGDGSGFSHRLVYRKTVTNSIEADVIIKHANESNTIRSI